MALPLFPPLLFASFFLLVAVVNYLPLCFLSISCSITLRTLRTTIPVCFYFFPSRVHVSSVDRTHPLL